MMIDELHEAAREAQARAIELRARTAVAEAEPAADASETSERLAKLAEEVAGLRRAMESRAVIEQAKGIIIAATGCDAPHAFELLVRQSQHENRKVAVVATELVASKIHLVAD